MSIPSSSRAWVSRAICGSFITSAAIEAAVAGSMPFASKIPASSRSSSSGMVAISCASLWISCSKTSRCTFIETYSPAAIENAPARSPAIPAMITTSRSTPDPATPKIRDRFETRPSFIPKIAARRAPDLLLATSCSTPTGPGWGVIREPVLPRRRSSMLTRRSPGARSVILPTR